MSFLRRAALYLAAGLALSAGSCHPHGTLGHAGPPVVANATARPALPARPVVPRPAASPSAPAAAVQRCRQGLDEVAAHPEWSHPFSGFVTPGGVVFPGIGADCKGIFSNRDFAKGWLTVGPGLPANLRATLLVEAVRESYCSTWPAPKPAACGGPELSDRAAAAAWPGLFDEVLGTELQGADLDAVREGFKKSWDRLFPSH